MRRFLLFALLWVLLVAAVPTVAQVGFPFPGPGTSHSGGGGGITVVNSCGNGGLASASCTTNMTGVTLLVATVTDNGGNSTAPSDTSSNTWSHVNCSTTPDAGCVWYVYSPTVTSSQTFSATPCVACAIAVIGFSGTTGSTVDQTGSYSGGSGLTACQTGSLTPGHNNEVVAAAATFFATTGASAYSVDSGMTKRVQVLDVAATNHGVELSYIVQTSAGAIQPTSSENGSPVFAACSTASFQ